MSTLASGPLSRLAFTSRPVLNIIRPVVENALYNLHNIAVRLATHHNIATRNHYNRVAGEIKLQELKTLIVHLQQGKDVVEILQNFGAIREEHRRVRCRERRLVIDTPVVVRALADGEDLILQRVAVVADDTDLDVDGHSVLTYLFGYAYS